MVHWRLLQDGNRAQPTQHWFQGINVRCECFNIGISQRSQVPLAIYVHTRHLTMEMGSVTILLQLVDMWYQLWSAEDINQYDFLITGQSGFPLKLVNCSLGTLPQGISFAKPLHPAGFMLQGTHLCFLGIAQKLN